MTDKTTQEELTKRVAELEREVRELESDLIHDKLTGLKTRSFFEEEMGIYLDAIAHSEDGKRKEWFGFRKLSVIFFDIDHFKKINDTYGHAVGDAALKLVAQAVMESLRSGDTAARWGGEEMVVSLLGASEDDAAVKADEIRKKIEGLKVDSAPDLSMTISAGVASSEKGIGLEELVARADKALYEAKEGGRNRTAEWSHLESSALATSSV